MVKISKKSKARIEIEDEEGLENDYVEDTKPTKVSKKHLKHAGSRNKNRRDGKKKTQDEIELKVKKVSGRKIKGRKSMTLHPDTHEIMVGMRDKLTEKLGKKASFDDLVHDIRRQLKKCRKASK